MDIDDTIFGLPVISPVCSVCKHYNPRETRLKICTAFPDGIPEDIWMGRNSHTEPYEGDHGIQFEPRRDAVSHRLPPPQSND